jgi:hypothetical protein
MKNIIKTGTILLGVLLVSFNGAEAKKKHDPQKEDGKRVKAYNSNNQQILNKKIDFNFSTECTFTTTDYFDSTSEVTRLETKLKSASNVTMMDNKIVIKSCIPIKSKKTKKNLRKKTVYYVKCYCLYLPKYKLPKKN